MREKAALLVLLVALGLAGAAGAAEHRFGFGGHYWVALDDFAEELDIDEDGIAPYFTYQFVPAGLFRLELDVEYFPDGFGGATSEAFAPAAYALLEWGLYGGLGVGVTYSDTLDSDFSDPFYAARLGWDFQILPRLHVDVNANYRANSFSDLEEYDTDSITLGAAVRVAFGERD